MAGSKEERVQVSGGEVGDSRLVRLLLVRSLYDRASYDAWRRCWRRVTHDSILAPRNEDRDRVGVGLAPFRKLSKNVGQSRIALGEVQVRHLQSSVGRVGGVVRRKRHPTGWKNKAGVWVVMSSSEHPSMACWPLNQINTLVQNRADTPVPSPPRYLAILCEHSYGSHNEPLLVR